MREVGAESYSEYLDRLQVDADEFGHLFDAILINVTAFFRDPEHWDYLGRNILPTLIGEKPATAPIRVWTAGCASGEEAYGIAMLLADALGLEGLRRRVKIYATDVDEDALAIARAGAYPLELVQPVPAAMREKYFEHAGSRLVFRTDLRRSLIFGRHDLVQDAPISRLDLLLCRNTLMYFTPQAQDRVLAQFNHALNPTGFLFLGKAEMLMRQPEIFRSIDLKQRVFMKVPPHGLRDRLAALRDSSEPERVAEPVPQLPGLANDAAPFGQRLVNADARSPGPPAEAHVSVFQEQVRIRWGHVYVPCHRLLLVERMGGRQRSTPAQDLREPAAVERRHVHHDEDAGLHPRRQETGRAVQRVDRTGGSANHRDIASRLGELSQICQWGSL